MRLLATAHPGPALAVTVLAGLLASTVGLGAAGVALVVATVLTGQLTIGWSNDLIDLPRDRVVGRTDKPLVSGAISERLVRGACAAALVATVVLSLVAGWGLQLVTVAGGWAYNLGLKATALSWLPYAVAFGALPAYVAVVAGVRPPFWLIGAGALLGVGAHLVNVLPDLADDAATGVRGLPHRLGARSSQALAVAVLVAAALLLVTGADLTAPVSALVLALSAVLGAVALFARGRTPFRAVVAMALVDVVVLVWSR